MQHPKQAEYSAKYRAANVDKVRAMKADWKARNKAKVSGYHLKEKYGITMEEYDSLMAKANSACEICSTPVHHITDSVGVGIKACVDHCHSTGKVRGILCHLCNRQLSFFELHAQAAMVYLKKDT